MDWDAEVDVLCVGAGIGGLATAIAAFDVDADVMVTGALRVEGRRWVRGSASGPRGGDATTLGDLLDSRIDEHGVPRPVDGDEPPDVDGAGDDKTEVSDATVDENLDPTAVYFAAVTAEPDAGPDSTEQPSRARGVPTRSVREQSESERHSRTIETFFGAALTDWARVCRGSVTAALYSTVRGWTADTVRDSSDRTLRLVPIGTIEWGTDHGLAELFDWLAAAVADRDIATSSQTALQGLVFDGPRIIGAELSSPDGPYFVRARHGVVISPDFTEAGPLAGGAPSLAGAVEVCIIAYPASRFARVELVAR